MPGHAESRNRLRSSRQAEPGGGVEGEDSGGSRAKRKRPAPVTPPPYFVWSPSPPLRGREAKRRAEASVGDGGRKRPARPCHGHPGLDDFAAFVRYSKASRLFEEPVGPPCLPIEGQVAPALLPSRFETPPAGTFRPLPEGHRTPGSSRDASSYVPGCNFAPAAGLGADPSAVSRLRRLIGPTRAEEEISRRARTCQEHCIWLAAAFSRLGRYASFRQPCPTSP